MSGESRTLVTRSSLFGDCRCQASKKSVGRHRIERQRALVAIHLQEERAHPVAAHWGDEAVALALLDADRLGTVLLQQRSAVGAGNVAAEIQYPYTAKDTRYDQALPGNFYFYEKSGRSSPNLNRPRPTWRFAWELSPRAEKGAT